MVINPADKWRMPGAHLPRAHVPIHTSPHVCWAASSGSCYIYRGGCRALRGHHVHDSRRCCSSVFPLKSPTGKFITSLCGTAPCPPNRPKGSREHPQLIASCGERLEGPRPPQSQHSWEKCEEDTGAQCSCKQRAHLAQLCIPVGASQSWHQVGPVQDSSLPGVAQALGVPHPLWGPWGAWVTSRHHFST